MALDGLGVTVAVLVDPSYVNDRFEKLNVVAITMGAAVLVVEPNVGEVSVPPFTTLNVHVPGAINPIFPEAVMEEFPGAPPPLPQEFHVELPGA